MSIDWNISYCAAYIVPPSHNNDTNSSNADKILSIAENINGSVIQLSTDLHKYFQNQFLKANLDCTIEIKFESDGSQNNPVRDLIRIIAFDTESAKENASRQLAARLALASDKRSPTGLFVIVKGEYGQTARVVLWKFPAGEMVQAEFSEQGLTLNLAERAFARGTEYFKAAVFEDIESNTAFWEGKVEDKQAVKRVDEISDLWGKYFLQAVPSLTNKRGTKMLAKGVKDLLEQSYEPEIRQALIGAATTIKSQEDRNITLSEFAENYLPSEIRLRFLEKCGMAVSNITFRIDKAELGKQLGLRTLSLDNGFSVTGPLEKFVIK